MKKRFLRLLTFIGLASFSLTILVGCSVLRFGQVKEVGLSENKLFMNYFKYWFRSFGYKVESVHTGLIFENNGDKNGFQEGNRLKGPPFFKKKLLIMTSIDFKDGEKGNCLIDLSIFKEEFRQGDFPFYINLNCQKPFQTLEREKELFPKISKIYSIKLKPILNFKVQRSFRYFVESKRWPVAIRLLDQGADPRVYINKYENIGTTPLNIAFSDFWNFYNRIHSIPFINRLLKIKGVIDFEDAGGSSALVKFLLKDKRLVVKKLIQEGAVLKVKSKNQKEVFLELLKNYKKESEDFMELFYQKLNSISQFPSSISI